MHLHSSNIVQAFAKITDACFFFFLFCCVFFKETESLTALAFLNSPLMSGWTFLTNYVNLEGNPVSLKTQSDTPHPFWRKQQFFSTSNPDRFTLLHHPLCYLRTTWIQDLTTTATTAAAVRNTDCGRPSATSLVSRILTHTDQDAAAQVSAFLLPVLSLNAQSSLCFVCSPTPDTASTQVLRWTDCTWAGLDWPLDPTAWDAWTTQATTTLIFVWLLFCSSIVC